MYSEVRARAQAIQDDVVRFLRDVVAIPSTSTNEQAVVERIAEEMRRAGLEDVHFDPVGNVLGRVGHGPITILYDSHIDTVGVGDPKAWSFDPFEGKVENGVVYGRGASDNKAAIATMVHGARLIKEMGLAGAFTLWVIGVVEEEAMDGWAVGETIRTGHIKPDFVVLGESTNLDIYRGHRGRCEIKVTTKGVSCHASAPERGVNALYKMQRILAGIEQLNEHLAHDEFLGKGTIVASCLETKTPSYNAVPDEAVLYIDRRLTIGETAESAMAEIKALPGAEEAAVELLRYSDPSWTGYQKDVAKDYPTWVLPEEHPLVQAGADAAETILGRRPGISRWVFSTDGIATAGQLG
ncbi:MAG TPA: YgeY family selenium metabolism-linked hydrolase, partial [Symbiobacteriaceae bacterium]|nr:YgeY family selenium metabolism-linked hydrolase [Symbiobacteriaceae bacterium]